jgi:hypothetical protein
MLPAQATTVFVDAELGRRGLGAEAVREWLDFVRESALDGRGATAHVPSTGELAIAAVRLELGEELRSAVGRLGDSRHERATTAILDLDLATAADVSAEMGTYLEHELRRLAAERALAEGRREEADVQLDRALTFYRPVGAARYVRALEELRAKIA